MQIITTHKSTDFDAFASLIAGSIIYPDAVPVLPKTINPNVKTFLALHKDIFDTKEPREIDLEKVKKLIVVDANRWSRLERFGKIKKREDIEVFVWDHHLGGDMNPVWSCQEEVGANITLMVKYLSKIKMNISPIQATLFLMGLYEDTGSLTFPATKPDDAYAAAYLLEKGADLKVLTSFLSQAYGERQKEILFDMLRTSNRMKINGYTISIKTIEISGHIGNLSLVVHMYREILNVDAAFGIFLDKEKDSCIVIGRSRIDDLNIGKIMRTLGGGGHTGAGSALMKSVNPEIVSSLLKEFVQGNSSSSIQLSDLMSYPVFTVDVNTSMEDVAMIFRDKGVTGVPVTEGEKLVGIISRRDFKKMRKESQIKAPVKAYMSTRVISIGPEKSPMEAASLMIKHDIGRLPVVKNGELIGIVTRTDSMRYLYDLLPD
ncbi:MAG: CBS domain-containing protein [Proteobacteria bacterium]|nr:CBS domain-containing protein [Pseudomonadota bacterium]